MWQTLQLLTLDAGNMRRCSCKCSCSNTFENHFVSEEYVIGYCITLRSHLDSWELQCKKSSAQNNWHPLYKSLKSPLTCHGLRGPQ